MEPLIWFLVLIKINFFLYTLLFTTMSIKSSSALGHHLSLQPGFFSWLFSLSTSLQLQPLHFLLCHHLLSRRRHLQQILLWCQPHCQLFSCTSPPQKKKNKVWVLPIQLHDYEYKTSVTTTKVTNYTYLFASRCFFGGCSPLPLDVAPSSISRSIFLWKHGSQYATNTPAFQSATSSSFSMMEHGVQKYSLHVKQMYLVFFMQDEQGLSFPAIFECRSFAHGNLLERVELWVKYNLYLMYALDSAHEKVDVWIEVELLPLYSPGAVERNGRLTQIQICRP